MSVGILVDDRTTSILFRVPSNEARVAMILLEAEVFKARLQFVRIRQDVSEIKANFHALEKEALWRSSWSSLTRTGKSSLRRHGIGNPRSRRKQRKPRKR